MSCDHDFDHFQNGELCTTVPKVLFETSQN